MLKELAKLLTAYTVTAMSAVLPLLLMWLGILLNFSGANLVSACILGAVLTVPLSILSTGLSSNVAGFFVKIWGSKHIARKQLE